MASAWEAPWNSRWPAIFVLPVKAPYSRSQKLSRARHPDGVTLNGFVHYFGRAKAIELALTGSQITATEAHALGAVNHVVAGAEVLSKAQKIANGIARMRTKSIKCTMGAMHVPYRIGLAEGKATEHENYMEMYDPRTFVAAVTALFEQKTIEFTD